MAGIPAHKILNDTGSTSFYSHHWCGVPCQQPEACSCSSARAGGFALSRSEGPAKNPAGEATNGLPAPNPAPRMRTLDICAGRGTRAVRPVARPTELVGVALRPAFFRGFLCDVRAQCVAREPCARALTAAVRCAG
jgi:hypothetical protein